MTKSPGAHTRKVGSWDQILAQKVKAGWLASFSPKALPASFHDVHALVKLGGLLGFLASIMCPQFNTP